MDSSQTPSPPRLVPDEEGNYSPPPILALRRVWNDFCEEVATPEDVHSVIMQVGSFATAQINILDTQVKEGTSRREDETFSAIYEAFETIVEGCELMLFEFSEEFPEGVEEEPEEGFFCEGLAIVQEGVNQMVIAHRQGIEHVQEMSEVNCPFCQHLNTRGTPKCDKCGRPMPVSQVPKAGSELNVKEHQGLERKQVGADGEHTKNYVYTAQILEGWKAGQVSVEQLTEYLNTLEHNLKAHLKDTDLQEKIIQKAPATQQDDLFEALDLTREGLNISLAAVEKMRLAFVHGDDRYLFFGLTDMEEGSRILVDAYWLNKEASNLAG